MKTQKTEAIFTVIDTPTGPRTYLKDEKRLAEYVADGMTDEEIADAFQCTVRTVMMSRRHYRILRSSGRARAIADRDALRNLIQSGLTSHQIAQRFGCSKKAVERAKARYGLRKPSPECGRRLTDEDRANLAWMLDDGWPLSEIAATTGWAETTIRRHLSAGQAWTAFEAGEFGGALHKIRRNAARLDWLPANLSDNTQPIDIRHHAYRPAA